MSRKRLICFLPLFILVLFACKTIQFDNPQNEQVDTVERYNEIVKEAAITTFENYYFIDLRPNEEYKQGYISNFHSSNRFIYTEEIDLESLISLIEKENKAGKTVPIILLDSGQENDTKSTIVYDYLVNAGYLNVKDILLGYYGLRDAYQTGFPYSLRDGSDCGCD